MKGISLSSVVQVINLERQSCDIRAQADGRVGELHFRDGDLIDATADDLAGQDAAYAILAWKNPEFEVSTEHAPRDRSIEADLTHLLLETARRQDEEIAGMSRSRDKENGNDPSPEVTPPSVTVAAVPHPVPHAAPEPAGPAASVVSDPRPALAVMAVPSADPQAPRSSGTLNAADLKRVIEIAQDGLGDALLSADVYSSADGTSYVGVHSMPAACALFNRVTELVSESLTKSRLPALERYYMAELADSKLMLVAPCGSCQLNLVVDSTRVQLGLLLNVILPEVLSALKEASGK